jgi:hypothetical protein
LVKDPDQQHEVLRRHSPRLTRWFVRWLRGYFRRNFNGVRRSLAGAPPAEDDDPLIVYTNHPSWWDPIHFLLLANHAMPDRRMFGPFDAEAMAKYKMFRRLGGFGVERSTRRGVVDFLVTSRAILATPGTSLWITAQPSCCSQGWRTWCATSSEDSSCPWRWSTRSGTSAARRRCPTSVVRLAPATPPGNRPRS